MKFTEKLNQVWRIKDLRRSILFVFFILVVFRIAAHIPVPGVNLENLKDLFNRNQFLGMINLLSGGAMGNFSVVALGLGPYITATIIMQLLTMIFPRLEAIAKEGSSGHKRIENYSRIITVPLAILQAYSMLKIFSQTNPPIVGNIGWAQMLTTMLVMTAGTMFLVWLGDLITEKKIGNGVSLLIFAGIVETLPQSFGKAIVSFNSAQVVDWAVLAILAVLTVAAVVFITEAQRNIPVTYARRIQGNKMYGGMDTYLPIKVNQTGMIPIIFAVSIVIFPGLIGQFLKQVSTHWIASLGNFLTNFFQNQTIYGVCYFLLVFVFTYFYTSIIFHPDQISENLQKQGAFIPGIRPGQPTASYLSAVSSRIMLAGALFLGLVAVLPVITQNFFKMSPFAIGGAAVLIVVSVVLETIKQINAQVSMHEYETF